MTRIYLLRHGQTQFNQKGLIQGSCDSKLTALGIEQAKSLSEYLDRIDFAAVYCSTSERTLDTVTYATNKKYPITPCKEFKEIDFGDVEGEDESKLFMGLPSSDFPYLLLNDGWSAIDGESGVAFTKRIFEKLDEITVKYPNESILIATHGGTIANIVLNIAPNLADDEASAPNNASITIIEHHNEYRLIEYNLDVTRS